MDDEMNRSGFDDLTADRLLSGQVAPQDAPPEYQLIADAVRRASDPGSPTDSERERAIVAAMVETLRSAPSAYQPARRIAKARMRGVKVAAIAAAVLISATAAGAATNTLPGPAQRAISDAASHLGLSLPKPSAPHGGPGRAGKPVGPDAAAHAKYGLCSAYAGGAVDHQSAQPQRRLCRVCQSQAGSRRRRHEHRRLLQERRAADRQDRTGTRDRHDTSTRRAPHRAGLDTTQHGATGLDTTQHGATGLDTTHHRATGLDTTHHRATGLDAAQHRATGFDAGGCAPALIGGSVRTTDRQRTSIGAPIWP